MSLPEMPTSRLRYFFKKKEPDPKGSIWTSPRSFPAPFYVVTGKPACKAGRTVGTDRSFTMPTPALPRYPVMMRLGGSRYLSLF